MIKKKILLIFRIIPCSIPTMHIDINDCDGKFGERKKKTNKKLKSTKPSCAE